MRSIPSQQRSAEPAARGTHHDHRDYGLDCTVSISEMTPKRREMPIMRRRFVLSVLFGFALGLSAPVDLPAHAADAVAAGKEKAELCAGCHGDNGISQTENIPSLAGQQDQFIQWQLVFFRSGARKNEQMQPIVEQITNEDIRNLGAYFASLTPPKPPAPDDNPDLSKKGAQAAVGRRCAVVPYRFICRNQGGCPPCRPARGISGQGAARLQIGRAIRRRRRGDGGCRLSPQRRGNHRARALSGASAN